MKNAARAAALAALLACPALAAAPVPSPSQFLNLEVGADKKLADYKQIASYFQALKAASPRVDVEVLGKTTLGEDMFMAIISSEDNIRNQKRIRETADPAGAVGEFVVELREGIAKARG